MTHVHGDPTAFKDDVIRGFAAAYGRYATRVAGASGFVRAGGNPGRVALVVGGGSGHFPSYAGIVGEGLAQGCAMGDVFTSPSAEQVYRIARAAEGGHGVVLAYGNYAGDRLNFASAEQRLRAQGIDTVSVFVTDDIASAPPADRALRRGIAGTFIVYKVGGAAAERGDDLAEVERLMRRANDRTFSFGVAFSGCTLPGAAEPLFSVEQGRMEFGLGIHGEPGVSSQEWMPAPELALTLVDAVLAERPADAGDRAAVLVNGLGATKYEELLVLYGHVDALLREHGVVPVLPEVGEMVTSLDMAGCSLSVTWLDEELEACWAAPADTASYRREAPASHDSTEAVAVVAVDDAAYEIPPASHVSRRAAGTMRALLQAWVRVAEESQGEWGRLDAVAGDGDHGSGMLRGLREAQRAADIDAGIGWCLRTAGSAFSDRAGGTSGILWGIALATLGESLGDQEPVTAARLADALDEVARTLTTVGGAQRGDKTMLDALLPFTEEFSDQVTAGASLSQAWESAADVASRSAATTADLIARVGRARPLAERGRGTPDPGATSLAELLVAAGPFLQRCGAAPSDRQASTSNP